MVLQAAVAFREPFDRQALRHALSSSVSESDLGSATAQLLKEGILVESDELFSLAPGLSEPLSSTYWQGNISAVRAAIGRGYALRGKVTGELRWFLLAVEYLQQGRSEKEAAALSLSLLPLLRREHQWGVMAKWMGAAIEASQGIEKLEAACALAQALLRLQHFGESIRLHDTVLRAAAGRAEVRHRAVEASCRVALALFYFLDGAPVQARNFLETALSLRREMGDLAGQSECLRHLAILDEVDEELDHAEARAREALVCARRSGSAGEESLAVLCCASIADQRGDPSRVRRILGEGRRVAESWGGPLFREYAHALRQVEVAERLFVG